MNEAQRILRKELETIQNCIAQIDQDIKLKKESLETWKFNLKQILDALMVLESETK